MGEADGSAISRSRFLVLTDLRHYPNHPVFIHALIALPIGMILSVWLGSVVSPAIVAIIVAFAALEPLFDNAVFKWGHDPLVFAVVPVRWDSLLRSRNAVAVALHLILSMLYACVFYYVTPVALRIADLLEGMLFVWSLMPLVVIAGNAQSVHAARRHSGLRMGDVAELCWMLVSLAVMSVGYLLFMEVFDSWILMILIGSVCAVAVIRWSIPRAAGRIEERNEDLVALR